jgi:integrase
VKGSTIKRGSTWTAYWSTVNPATGRRRQHSKGGFVRQKDARTYLNEILSKVERGTWRPDRRMTVGELLDNWLAAQHSRGLRPGTLDMYANVAGAWVAPHLGGLLLQELTPAKAQTMVDTLRAGGSTLGRGSLSPRSVQLAVQILKAATRWAHETELLSRDPLTGFRRPRANASSKASGAWTPQEAAEFLRVIEHDRLRAAWWLLLNRGPRRGELCGLKWSQVDLDRGALRVVETTVMVAHQPAVSEPKTDAGRRSVPLDERLVAELRAHQTRQLEERAAAGEAWENTGYVFANELGRPFRPVWLSRRFDQLQQAGGLRRIRLHDLRHTAASLMLAEGYSPKAVAEILGHASDAVTTQIYQHLLPGMAESAGAHLTKLLSDLAGY